MLKKIKLIPAVSQVLVEYEKIYTNRQAREMFDILCWAILQAIKEEIPTEEEIITIVYEYYDNQNQFTSQIDLAHAIRKLMEEKLK